MLSKSATMLLGLINQRPLNPYEIIKQLQIMNVHRWYNIANSTVYATLKVLEKKEYIYGSIEKDGNMPDKTIYSLTDKGKQEFVATLQQSSGNNCFSCLNLFSCRIEMLHLCSR